MNKNIYRAALLISFIAINALVLFGISSVLAFLNTGADRGNMLHTEVRSVDVYLPKIIWSSLENPGRPMEKPTLAEIQKDYLDAWYIRNVAYLTNNPFGIEDFYTDSSRINLFEILKFNKENGITIEATTINHQPELEFYSADGQLVVFTDRNVVEYQKVFQDENLVYTIKDTSAYQVMMLLEDGFWRIRHLVKTDGYQEKETPKAIPVVRVGDKTIFVEDKSFVIKGMNYYPQKNPWDMFGDEFDPEVINKDFKIIKQAGLNSIRIFVQYEDFGKADVKEEKLQKLETVLNLAEKNNLKTVVTLFDFYGDYSLLNWSLTHRHAETIVSRFKSHPAIIAWDIKNEPDLDFENRGKENVIGWLSEMINVIRKFDPNHLVTIGWSSPEAAINLKNELDIISYHYYLDVDEFEEHHQKIKDEIQEKPFVVQEFGLSSYKGIWNPLGYNEKEQAEYHKKMQASFKKNKLAFMSWTLYDFEEIPTSVVGRFPWRKSKQTAFGFLDRLGKPKPAFDHISY